MLHTHPPIIEPASTVAHIKITINRPIDQNYKKKRPKIYIELYIYDKIKNQKDRLTIYTELYIHDKIKNQKDRLAIYTELYIHDKIKNQKGKRNPY